ncbi:MAG: hypothetical protein IJ097_00880 [Bacilli bacterium]|nr:hypothetical protein [Bacilli bacterium]
MNINEFMKTNEYPDFIKENSGNGKLKIRAYAASEALPVDGLNIIVSSVINNEEVVFFKGVTDTSGMIPTISLPAPKNELSNLIIPKTITYKIKAYKNINNASSFTINMYDGICVVQNINFVPGEEYGS